MSEERERGPFVLKVPLDASDIGDLAPEAAVRVAVVDERGSVTSETVELGQEGKCQARFEFKQRPGAMRVLVGPTDADDEDIVHLQTLSRSVSARAWLEPKVKLPPIRISPYYWHWWLRWCRKFVITGRLLCPDGSPVPGAVVCAYDVDWWWWWSSSQQVGCDVTDASGTFAIPFRWCCGWWPWWWWRLRHWQLEQGLVEKIQPVLERLPQAKVPVPRPKPTLGVLEEVLAEDGQPTGIATESVNPAVLPDLRSRLLERLPTVPELERLRVWPWWPWHPWWDCTPDIIFKATQNCDGQKQLILDESVWDARWNIPTHLNVTLVASGEACCVEDTPPPGGECVVIARVCDDVLDNIGGNPGAALAPAGYRNPGAIATSGDRPYAGVVPISGLYGSAADVDFYEFEWADAPSGPWKPMPPAAAGGFTRRYWGPQLGGGPVDFHYQPFSFNLMDGRLVIESREHFEANNEPLSWGTTRFWVGNRDKLMRWLTAGNVDDGTYYLRLAGYELFGGHLGKQQILPLCGTKEDNSLVVTIDNSTSALEPASDVIDVRINGVSAGPCSNVDATGGGVLEVDFVAYDVDEHLAFYTLIATYGKNLAVNLLAAPGKVLTPVALGAIPAADFVGPSYASARAQGAPGPHWRAGGLRLTIPDLRDAFPETCCYQIELRVYKRTIISCDDGFYPRKLSFYSLTVVV